LIEAIGSSSGASVTFNSGVTVLAGGEIEASGSGASVFITNINGGEVENSGLIVADNGGAVTLSDVQVENASGTIEATDANSLVSLTDADIVGGTLETGSLTSAADGEIEVGAGLEPTFFDGSTNTVTVDAFVQVDDGANLELLGSIDNAGTIVLGSESGAELIISGPVTLSGSGTVSLEGNASVITGAGDPSDELINSGNTISGSGTIEDLTLENLSGGVIDATGGTLSIDTGHTVTNSGTLEATNGGTLQIYDGVSNADGTIQAEDGGSSVQLFDITITGGTLTTGDAASNDGGVIEVVATGDEGTTVFDGSSDGALTVDGYVQIDDGASLELLGSVDNAGTIILGSESGAELIISGPVTLSGSGMVSLEGNASVITGAGDPSDELINSGNTISGSDTIEDLTLENLSGGVIDATGGTLSIDTGHTVTNSGTLEATSGGTLQIYDGIANSGSILADGGTVDIVGAVTANNTINGSATIEASGTLEFGATDAQTITFDGAGTLILDHQDQGDFSGSLGGFGAGDTIDLKALSYSASGETATWTQTNDAGGVLTISNGTNAETVSLAGTYSQNDFALTGDSSGGTDVISSPTTVTLAGLNDSGDAVENQAVTVSLGNTALTNVEYIWLNGGHVVQSGTDDSYTPQNDAGNSLDVVVSFTDPITGATDQVTALAGTVQTPALTGQIVYMTDASDPWGISNIAGSAEYAMNQAFGQGNWTADYGYSTAPFTSNAQFIYLEGGAADSTDFFNFIANNLSTIESYVAGGGHLIINSASWYGGNINLGNNLADGYVGFGAYLEFSGNYTIASLTGQAVDPKNPIFSDPFDAGTSWSGDYFSHDIITGSGFQSLITGSGGTVLAEENYGLGDVVIGGITFPIFDSPSQQADNLLANILLYADGSPSDIVAAPITVAAGATVALSAPSDATVTFAGSTGTLLFEQATTFSGQISGIVGSGDVLDLSGFDPNSTTATPGTFVNGVTTLTVTDDTHSVTFALDGNYSSFAVTGDQNGGVDVVAITTTAPTVTSLSDVTPGGSTDLDAGKTITFTLDTSEAVNAVGSTLTLSNGASAAYASGSGSETLTFTYTVASGDANTSDLKVTGYSGTIADNAGNALVAAGVIENTGVAITTTAPTVTSLSDVTPGGSTDLDAGKTITFTLATSEAVNAVGSTLTLSDGASAAYASGSGSETLTFTYTVASGDANTSDLKVTGYSGTIADNAGNALVAAGVIENTGVAINPAGIEHWVGTSTADWSTASASDWNFTSPPNSAIDTEIDANGTYTVTITSADSAKSLTVNDAGATVLDENGGSLTLGGALTIDAGTFELAGSGTLSGETAITNAGTFEVADGFTLATPVTNTNGTVEVDAGDTLTLDGTTIIGGTISLAQEENGPIQSISEIAAPGLNGIAPVMSSDGQFIAFLASTNVPKDSGGGLNVSAVELYDSTSGQLTNIAALVPSADLHPGESFNNVPSISADGQYVVFEGQYQVVNFNSGSAPNQGPNTNSESDYFLYNSQSQTVSLVSSGASDNGGAEISGNGQLIAASFTNQSYQDYAVVMGDSGNVLTQITGDPNFNVQSGNTFGDPGSVEDPAISSNGQFVSFWSTASEIAVTQNGTTTTFDTGNTAEIVAQVYVYDRQNNTLQEVSVNNQGQRGNADSGAPSLGSNNDNDWPSSLSADGSYVLFQSSATNLVAGSGAGNPNGVTGVVDASSNIYLYDTRTDTITLVSAGLDGAAANGTSYFPEISANGDYVIFESTASNLVAGGSGGQAQTYLYDIQTGTIQIVSAAADGLPADSESDLASSTSADGSIVAFGSLADNLAVPDANDGYANVFVVDLNQTSSTPSGAIVVTANATISGNAILEGGAVTVESGVTLTLDNVTVRGTTIADDGIINFTGSSTVDDGATISGGQITIANGQTLTLDDVTIANSTVTANGIIEVDSGETLTYAGTDTFNSAGDRVVINDGTIVHAGTLLNGSPMVTFEGDGTDILDGGNQATVTETTVNDGNTFEGYQTFGKDNGEVTIDNVDGTYDANVGGEAIVFDTGNTVTNAGTLEATDGGTLEIENSTVADAGTIEAGIGSQIDLSNATIEGGTLIDNAQIDITGSSTINNNASLTGGLVGIDSGQTLTLDNVSLSDTTIEALAVYSFSNVADPLAATNDFQFDNQGLEINNSGEVVGNYGDANGNFYGFIDSSGTYSQVSDPLAVQTSPFNYGGTIVTGINDSGQVVGYYQGAESSWNGFIDSNGSYTTFNDPLAPQSTQGLGINNSGEVVGVVYVGNNDTEGFIYSDGNFTNLQDQNASPNYGTYAFAINNSGQVLGDYYDANDDVHGFIYSNGTFTDITDPLAAEVASGGGTSGTHAEAINNSGQVVGYYVDASGAVHGFLYSGGSYTTLDDPSGVDTVVEGINDAGEIVGYYWNSSGNSQIFTYSNGIYTDLNDSSNNGGVQSVTINDAGEVVGTYYSNNGELQGLLADPSTSVAALHVASGDTLTLAGATITGVSITDNGTIAADGGTFTVSSTASISGSGNVEITNGGTADFLDAFNQAVTFLGAGTLQLAQSASFTATVSGLTPGDANQILDLGGFASHVGDTFTVTATQSGADTILLVTDTSPGNGNHESVTLFGNETTGNGFTWTAMADGNGGADVFDPAAAPVTVVNDSAIVINDGADATIGTSSSETVTFTGGTGSLVLNDPESFTGQIVGFTGTAPDAAHSDTIDLVGINYDSPNFSEAYNAQTGLLTVSDGSNTANLTFDNFNATLDFASDGDGGTLITDPPAAGAASDTSALSTTTAESVSGTVTFADDPSGAVSASITPDGSNYISSFSLSHTSDADGSVSVGFNFMASNDQIDLAPGQTLTQSYNVSLTDAQSPAANVSQTVSVTIGGPGNDNFVFGPGIGADTIVNFNPQHDAIELDHFASAQTIQELQSLITADAHGDAIINLGHNDSITLANTTTAQLQQAIQAGHVLLH
jgi:probable HAF family extracellular repeat protein